MLIFLQNFKLRDVAVADRLLEPSGIIFLFFNRIPASNASYFSGFFVFMLLHKPFFGESVFCKFKVHKYGVLKGISKQYAKGASRKKFIGDIIPFIIFGTKAFLENSFTILICQIFGIAGGISVECGSIV